MFVVVDNSKNSGSSLLRTWAIDYEPTRLHILEELNRQQRSKNVKIKTEKNKMNIMPRHSNRQPQIFLTAAAASHPLPHMNMG